MSQKFSWFTRVAGVFAVVGSLAIAGVAYAVVPTLSQTSVTVGLGQSVTITSQNGNNVYMGTNSSPTVASISINGTQVTVKGVGIGGTTVQICSVGTSADCTNLYVTGQSTAASGISFSQSTLSLAVGSNQTITVSGGNGTYSVTNNSNTSVISTGLSGSALTITGVAAGTGTVNVCDSSNTCGTVTVTIGSTSSSGLSYSQNNVSVVAGNNLVVTVSGGNGSYHISNNSNSGVSSVGLSGNQVTLFGEGAGTATITVCDTANVCGPLYVTVTGSTTSSANQAVTFSVTNPSVAVGQTTNVTLSGGASGYVVFSNGSPSVVQATINGGSVLALYGETAGTDSITICATAGGCTPISVTVTGSGSATTSGTTTPTTTAVPTVTQTTSGSTVTNAALVSEIQTLQAAVTQALTQIQSIQNQLNQIEAQVNAGAGVSINTSASASAPAGGSYDFTELLSVGSQDAQVTQLQQRLTTLGYYSGPVTGYYGALTGAAVSKYQTAHGIEDTGYVGPSTRAALNAGE